MRKWRSVDRYKFDQELLAVESNHNLLPNSETELEKNTRQRAKSSILKADRWLRYKVRGESKKASEQFNDAELDLSGEIELKIEIESEDDTLTEVWTAVKKYEWLCEDFVAEFTEFFPTHQMRLNRIRKPKWSSLNDTSATVGMVSYLFRISKDPEHIIGNGNSNHNCLGAIELFIKCKKSHNLMCKF